MACNCGKGQKHSFIATTSARVLADQLRQALRDNHVVEPQTIVCVENDSYTTTRHGPNPEVSKIVLTFHDVSDVQWVIDALARNQQGQKEAQ